MTPPVELPVLAAPGPPPGGTTISRARYAEVARRVRLLSWLSLGWMTIEGAVAITAGVLASSIALVGFGLDSVIEGVASVIIIWRFTGDRVFSHSAERRAQKLVAIQFFLLAPYVGIESVRVLVDGEHPGISVLGIALSAGSVVLMPMLGIAKERLADQIGSAATKGEGRQNMLCAYLAGALLVGLLGNAIFGAWWLDPVVGLLIAAVAVREGVEAWRGEGCCVSSPLDGASFAADGCDGDCCAPSSEIPSCSLDPEGLVAQRRRYEAIGAAVLGVERSPRQLVVRLGPDADLALVEEALRVERGCCPFFELDLDSRRREMIIGVASEDEVPALEAIAWSLGSHPPTTGGTGGP
ncbi:MAG TPA: cation transporter [Solirubrobacterales bacterium]|nr:cation transporter [Solirubrobacterales bacterium]